MRCAGLFVILLFAGATPGVAGTAFTSLPSPATGPSPSHPLTRSIDLSAIGEMRSRTFTQQPEEPLFSRAPADSSAREAAAPGLSLGPFRTEFDSTPGRPAHLGAVRLNGVTVFGASVGGRIDGRSAHLVLSWQTGP
jgi:hypothetical protein